MLDDRMITESSRDNDAPVWNTKANENAWKLYLGDLYGTDEVPVYAAPARLTDFHGLPPAITFVGTLDPFHDETRSYIRRLKAEGIPVAYRIFEGCYHAFDIMAPKSKPAMEAEKFLMKNFAYAVRHFFAAQPELPDTE